MRLLQDHASENADNYEDEAQNNEDVNEEDKERQEQTDEEVHKPTPNSKKKQHSDDSFEMKFYAVQKNLGRDKAVRLFSSDSFYRRVVEQDFLEISSSSSSSWAKCLLSASFRAIRFAAALKSQTSWRNSSSSSSCWAKCLLSASFPAICFAAALDFLAKLPEFVELLGQVLAVRLFSRDSFCRRVEEPDFLAKLLQFVELLGQVLAVRLFSRDSFCCRVEEPGFLA
jgi:hypothetical protein